MSSYTPLSPSERAALKAQAHALKPVVLIGPEGLTDAVLQEIDRNLNAHALIKIRMFEDDRTQRETAYHTLCTRLGAHPVQHIGKLFVVWRPIPAESSDHLSTPTSPRRAGAAPRTVTVFQRKPSSLRRTMRKKLRVLGNQRVTQSGSLKRAKVRQTSIKKSIKD